MQLFSGPHTATRIGVDAATLRKWLRKEWVNTHMPQIGDRWAFTPGDVALLSVTAALADFGIDAADAYQRAKAALPDLKPDDSPEDVIAYAKGKRMSCTRRGEVSVGERFPKVEGAMLLVDVGDVVRDALEER